MTTKRTDNKNRKLSPYPLQFEETSDEILKVMPESKSAMKNKGAKSD